MPDSCQRAIENSDEAGEFQFPPLRDMLLDAFRKKYGCQFRIQSVMTSDKKAFEDNANLDLRCQYVWRCRGHARGVSIVPSVS